MKKILHISKYYYPFSGGTEQIARDVVLALKVSTSKRLSRLMMVKKTNSILLMELK